jgi:hypothetical protein
MTTTPAAPFPFPYMTADPAFLSDTELLVRRAWRYPAPTELEREGRSPFSADGPRAAWLAAVVAAPNLDAVIALLEDGTERITRTAWRDGIDPRAWCGWTEHGGHYAFRRVMAARLLSLGRAFQAAAGRARNPDRIAVARRFLGLAPQAARNGLVNAVDLREIEVLARAYTDGDGSPLYR